VNAPSPRRCRRTGGRVGLLLLLVCHGLGREDFAHNVRLTSHASLRRGLTDLAYERGGLLPSFEIGHDAPGLAFGNDHHEAHTRLNVRRMSSSGTSPGTLYQSEYRGAIHAFPAHCQRPLSGGGPLRVFPTIPPPVYVREPSDVKTWEERPHDRRGTTGRTARSDSPTVRAELSDMIVRGISREDCGHGRAKNPFVCSPVEGSRSARPPFLIRRRR